MKRSKVPYYIGLALALAFFVTVVSLADEKIPPPKPVRSVAIDAKLLEVYTSAQKQMDEAQKAVEASTVWKDLVISRNQLQSATLYIMAEAGIKPSDECKPVFDDRTKALLRFDCPTKDAVSKP